MRLVPHVSFDESQHEMVVYAGRMLLSLNKKVFPFVGKVFYSFGGSIELLLEGEGRGFLTWGEQYDVSIGDIGQCKMIPDTITNSHDSFVFRGFLKNFYIGDIIDCHTWRWCYFDMHTIIGDLVRTENGAGRDRLVFFDDRFEILFENRPNPPKVSSHTYFISHYCSLRRKDNGLVSVEDAQITIYNFSSLLCFVSGKRHAAMFIEGLNDNKTVYQCHRSPVDNCLAKTISWRPNCHDEDWVSLWSEYSKCLLQDVDSADVLLTAVHWYLEANMNHGMLEGAYIMAFAGVELMYNALIGKRANDGESKLNALLSLLCISPGKNGDVLSAKELVNMRNALTHYGDSNRKKYAAFNFDEKLQHMTCILYILELSILYYLKYDKHFYSRLDGTVRYVPWVVKSH